MGFVNEYRSVCRGGGGDHEVPVRRCAVGPARSEAGDGVAGALQLGETVGDLGGPYVVLGVAVLDDHRRAGQGGEFTEGVAQGPVDEAGHQIGQRFAFHRRHHSPVEFYGVVTTGQGPFCGGHLLAGELGLDAARRRGRVGGRQTVLTPAKERQARRMLAEGATKDEVAGVVGVSVSTLYRRLDSGVSRVGK